MTHGTRIDINAIKSVLTRWITEGHITPLAAFNRFWGYTFHLMQAQCAGYSRSDVP